MRHATLMAPLAFAFALSAGCSLYFGDGRGDDDNVILDAPDFGDAPDQDGGDPPDAPPPGDGGMAFPRPTAPMHANVKMNGAWVDVGLADWSCMGTPTSDQPSTGSIQLSGRVVDFQTTNGVGGASIVAYAPSTSQMVGSGTSSNGGATRGTYSMTLGMLPSTSRRYTFALTAQGYPGTYLLEQYIPPAATAMRDLTAFSDPTMNSLAAIVGVPRNLANAMAVGDIVDCQGRAVSNAVVIASRTRQTVDLIGGARTFYWSAGSPSVPQRNDQRPFSNSDGRFLIIDVPPISAGYAVQVLGFRTDAELQANTIRLVSQVWAPAVGNSISVAPYEPRRQ
jgi:hypothetical protein